MLNLPVLSVITRKIPALPVIVWRLKEAKDEKQLKCCLPNQKLHDTVKEIRDKILNFSNLGCFLF